MPCMTAGRSLAATGEGLRLASGDDTDVASVVEPEVKSMRECTASLGAEAACDSKSVESPTGAAMTPAYGALDVVTALARSDAVVTAAVALEMSRCYRYRDHGIRPGQGGCHGQRAVCRCHCSFSRGLN
ncbi:hypothetical protein MTO96_011332 [Rhipicephalus appendiculatus]